MKIRISKFIISSLFCSFLWALHSCKSNKYLVYDESLKKVTIDLSDTSHAFILNNFLVCKPCIPDFVTYSEGKKVVIVSLISDNKMAVRKCIHDMNLADSMNITYLFQFNDVKDSYKASRKNKLFRDYDFGQSPFLIMPNDTKSPLVLFHDDIKK
jgi:hypothetical protein